MINSKPAKVNEVNYKLTQYTPDALTLSAPIGSAPSSNSLSKTSMLPPLTAYMSAVLLYWTKKRRST